MLFLRNLDKMTKELLSLKWQMEPLHKSHTRDRFDCGIEPLNIFIKTQARKQQEKFVGRTFVAVPMDTNEKTVLGFYTLSAGSIQFESLPMDLKIPRYPVPVARLGRLAVDLSMKGRGLGSYLLWHALSKCARIASEQMGLVAVVVDAKNNEAKTFYEKFGFVSLQEHTHTLCLSIESISSSGGKYLV